MNPEARLRRRDNDLCALEAVKLHRFCYAHVIFASRMRKNLPDELDSA